MVAESTVQQQKTPLPNEFIGISISLPTSVFCSRLLGNVKAIGINHRKTLPSNAFNHHLYTNDTPIYSFGYSSLEDYILKSNWLFDWIFPSSNPTGSSNPVVQDTRTFSPCAPDFPSAILTVENVISQVQGWIQDL